jgi:hypothetical protein
MICQSGVAEEDLPLMLPERVELAKWRIEAERRRGKREGEQSASEERLALMPVPAKKQSLRGGLPPKRVREILGCTAAELNRWSSDGRFAPDGERHYYIQKSAWGRAWLPASVETAKSQLAAWRAQDATRKHFRRRQLRSVRSL